MAQLLPSQCSASGCGLPWETEKPTAVQSPRTGQDTPCKNVEPGGLGTGWTRQAVLALAGTAADNTTPTAITVLATSRLTGASQLSAALLPPASRGNLTITLRGTARERSRLSGPSCWR